jgi:hypothetical protein
VGEHADLRRYSDQYGQKKRLPGMAEWVGREAMAAPGIFPAELLAQRPPKRKRAASGAIGQSPSAGVDALLLPEDAEGGSSDDEDAGAVGAESEDADDDDDDDNEYTKQHADMEGEDSGASASEGEQAF